MRYITENSKTPTIKTIFQILNLYIFSKFPCGSLRWVYALESHSVDLKKPPSKNTSITLRATVAHYFSSETRFFDQQPDPKVNRERHELLIKSEKSEQKPNI